MNLTNAELAILSLITEKARHGYEIEAVIEQRGMREWTEIGFSSIYYLLKKLEGYGFITREVETGSRGPKRKVYRATEAGFGALVEESLRALSEPGGSYPPIMLGLANLRALPPDAVIKSLRAYEMALTGQLDAITARMQEQEPLPPHIHILFDYSLTRIRSELEWITRQIEQLER